MKIHKKSLLFFLSLQDKVTTSIARSHNVFKIVTDDNRNNRSNHHDHHGSSSSLSFVNKQRVASVWGLDVMTSIRGGDSSTPASTTTAIDNTDEQQDEEEMSLEDRVHAAMKKLGISVDGDDNDTIIDENEVSSTTSGVECNDGVCTLPSSSNDSNTSSTANNNEDIQTVTKRLAKEMNVDESIAFAAIGATMKIEDSSNQSNQSARIDESAARDVIQNELNAIQRVMEDCEEVKQLVSEGHDQTLSRRALAFADMNVEVARAILIADEEDAKAEEEAYAATMEAEKKRLADEEEKQLASMKDMKTVTVDANFDPTRPAASTTTTTANATPQPPQGAPKPAKKEDVVFQATSNNIQKIVLESPVPVLLDVYADWCGPCKALTPALEDMAIKGGGMFRLVKLNTDEERNISSALGVTSLPTVFGVRDGKIIHSFQGMPRSEDFMRNFMMGLFGAGDFNPKVTAEQRQQYDELSNKLIKIAGAAGFSFSQREALQVRTNARLDDLVEVTGDMSTAEESAKVLRSLLSNVIRDPFEMKFRRVNLDNKVIAKNVGVFAPAVAILKSVGFINDVGSPKNSLVLGKGKKIVNVAPFVVARDTIDKWIDLNRRAIATAARKKQDELARAKLLEEAEEVDEEEEDIEEVAVKIDPDACALKVRLEGKNKVHDISLKADDPLSSIIDALPIELPEGEELQITCTARRLIVKSTDTDAMSKSIRHHRLAPAASLVVKVINSNKDTTEEESTSSIKERAAARKSRKKGEHTMQSVGIYAKDDNAKGELIDGGGGVWYEHDVSDDEEEKPDESQEANDDAEDSESQETKEE